MEEHTIHALVPSLIVNVLKLFECLDNVEVIFGICNDGFRARLEQELQKNEGLVCNL